MRHLSPVLDALSSTAMLAIVGALAPAPSWPRRLAKHQPQHRRKPPRRAPGPYKPVAITLPPRAERSELRRLPQAARRHRPEEGSCRARPAGCGEFLLDSRRHRCGRQEEVRHRQLRQGARPRRGERGRLGRARRLRGRDDRHGRPAAQRRVLRAGRARASTSKAADELANATQTDAADWALPDPRRHRGARDGEAGRIRWSTSSVSISCACSPTTPRPTRSWPRFVKVMTAVRQGRLRSGRHGAADRRRAAVLHQGRQRLEDRRLPRRRAEPVGTAVVFGCGTRLDLRAQWPDGAAPPEPARPPRPAG